MRSKVRHQRPQSSIKIWKIGALGARTGHWPSYLPAQLAAVGGRGEVNIPPGVEEKKEKREVGKNCFRSSTPLAVGQANFWICLDFFFFIYPLVWLFLALRLCLICF